MTKSNSGFTLIEILIVIFIISVVALAATVNFGTIGSSRDIDNESYRLQQLLTLTAQTAMLEQVDLGIGLWRNGYAVWRYDLSNKQWKQINNDRILSAHHLPERVQLNLRVNKISQILPENEKTLRAPQLWFGTAGTASPAVVSITSAEISEDVVIEDNGNVFVGKQQ